MIVVGVAIPVAPSTLFMLVKHVISLDTIAIIMTTTLMILRRYELMPTLHVN